MAAGCPSRGTVVAARSARWPRCSARSGSRQTGSAGRRVRRSPAVWHSSPRRSSCPCSCTWCWLPPVDTCAGRSARVALGLLYVAAAVVAVGRALFRDPFLDPYCWTNCTDNVFLVHADPGLAEVFGDPWLWVSLGAGVLVAGVAFRRLAVFTRPARAAAWPVLAPAALAALACGRLRRRAAARARRGSGARLVPGRLRRYARYRSAASRRASPGLCSAPAGAREAIERLAEDLDAAPEPGTLRAALARSLGDPGLRVAYPLGGLGVVGGRRGPPRGGVGRRPRRTPITRHGEPVAVVIHDAGLPAAERWSDEIGSAGASRSTTSGSGPRCWPSSRTCGSRARGSSRPVTRRGGVSSVTCTTAPSSGCLRSPTSFVSLARTRRNAVTSEPWPRCSRRRHLRGRARARRAARARPRHLPGGAHRRRASARPWRRWPTSAPLPVERRATCRASACPSRSSGRPTPWSSGSIEAAVRPVAVTVRRDGDDVTIVVSGNDVGAVPVRARRTGWARSAGTIGLEDGTLRAEIPCA